MKILLDTHVFLWWLKDHQQLKKSTIQKIEAAHSINVSAVSLYEIYQKYGLGKLVLPKNFEQVLSGEYDFQILNFTFEHSRAIRELPIYHRDPFDLMLIAQAKADRLTFVTHDEEVWKFSKHISILKA